MMLPLHNWEFCRRLDCTNDRDFFAMQDRSSVGRWLQQYRKDVFKVAVMRALLSQQLEKYDLSRMSVEKVIDHIANQLAWGRLHIHTREVLAYSTSHGQWLDSLNEQGATFPLREPKPRTSEAVAANDRTHRIEFHFAVESGQKVHDELGFTMIHPDGTKESAKLSNGGLERDGVREGRYRLTFRYIQDCGWEQEAAEGEATVGMWVRTNGMEGSAAIFSVYDRFQTRKKPRVESKVQISSNYGFANFHYKQGLGEAAGGDFVFEVKIGMKRAHSDVLTIRPYPLDSLGWIQQRLKGLGYDPGPINGILDPSTQRAVRSFQEDNPELIADGDPGQITKRELSKA
jgi:hypothetical protein